MDRSLIDRYAAGAELPARAIAGLTPADLHAQPVAESWSIQHIVIHLLDADLIASERMKRIIAEPNPLIVAFDQNAFARRLHYEHLDAAAAAEMFRLNRQLTAEILRRLPDEDFQRTAVHTENGKMTLAGILEGYCEHLDHHVRKIREKRQQLGRPQ
jgi:uncharacterized damage-inducible protein DinB